MAPFVKALYEHASGSIAEIDGHTLFLRVGGDVREEDVVPFFQVFAPLVAERSPAALVVDGTYLSETSIRLRWQILRQARRVRGVARAAIFGLSPKLELLLWAVMVVKRCRQVRSFLWRHEAESWVHGQ